MNSSAGLTIGKSRSNWNRRDPFETLQPQPSSHLSPRDAVCTQETQEEQDVKELQGSEDIKEIKGLEDTKEGQESEDKEDSQDAQVSYQVSDHKEEPQQLGDVTASPTGVDLAIDKAVERC